MKTLLSTLAFCLLASNLAAQTDLLIYKFARTRVWQEYESHRDPATNQMKGRNILTGTSKDAMYWVIDRAASQMAEIRYYTVYVDGVKKKLYDISPWSISKLETDLSAYSQDANGLGDQFMEMMILPSARIGTNCVSLRASAPSNFYDPSLDSYFSQPGFVWDLIGKSTALKLSATLTLPDVAKSLAGEYQGADTEEFDNFYNPDTDSYELSYLRARADKGSQSATLDTALTLRSRTTSAGAGLTAGGLNNGIQTVVNALEALGYDLYYVPTVAP
jgi:hypothetical protein